MSSLFSAEGVPTEAEIAARLNAENGQQNPDIQFVESSSTKVQFAKEVAIISRDGQSENWLRVISCIFVFIIAVMCITLKIWLFSVFGWMFLALLPFLLYESLVISGGSSYQLLIFRELQSMVRTSKNQGRQRCKTGYFLDVQVLYKSPPAENSFPYYFTQLNCEQGVIWLGGGLSRQNENKFATALAEWLGVDLIPSREISVFENPVNPLLPFDNPWK
jgi:hypothetical protein